MEVDIVAAPRTEKGKEAVKKMRRRGRIPAVVYGHAFEPLSVSVDERSFRALMRREKGLHGLLSMRLEGDEEGEHTVVVKELQRHPLKDQILHVDFQRIRSDEKLHAVVSLRFEGEPVGVKAGGILQHYLYEVTVECYPKDLPEEVVVDVSHLNLKQNLRVSDLPRLPGVEYVNSPEEIVAAVTPKRVREAARVVQELFEVPAEEAEAAGGEEALEEAAAGGEEEASEAGAGETEEEE
ncbi:MAG: 50S ribosomal protein L25 [Actinobacteria bacterium]|nr:50S ribosomal protein L25 [Actinomycetota bacterium]